MARKLRIAATVFFGVLTIAVCVLWVRSFWIADTLYRFGVPTISLTSARGLFHLFLQENDASNARLKWCYVNHPIEEGEWPPPDNFLGFRIHVSRNGYSVAPQWFGALSAAALVVVPWNRARFSLRTLLIATTLVAVVLGLGVWLAS